MPWVGERPHNPTEVWGPPREGGLDSAAVRPVLAPPHPHGPTSNPRGKCQSPVAVTFVCAFFSFPGVLGPPRLIAIPPNPPTFPCLPAGPVIPAVSLLPLLSLPSAGLNLPQCPDGGLLCLQKSPVRGDGMSEVSCGHPFRAVGASL